MREIKAEIAWVWGGNFLKLEFVMILKLQRYESEYICTKCGKRSSYSSTMYAPNVNIFSGVYFKYVSQRIVESASNRVCSDCNIPYVLISIGIDI